MSEQSADTGIDTVRFRRGFLLLLVFGISFLFFAMIRSFLTTLLLAAIFSGLMYPLYERLAAWLGQRKGLASIVTILLFLLLLVVPASAFLGIVTSEAIQISQDVGPWVEKQVRQRHRLEERLQQVPFLDQLAPYADQILAKAGELAGNTGTFVVAQLAAFTRGTVLFFFLLFVMLYAMFFFLKDGPKVLERILYYLPLSYEDEQRMLGKFVSVTRATVKGTLVIGLIQGGLAGVAFAVFGVPGAAFWGTIMAVLSILPGVGSAIVWIPAVLYLVVIGRTGAAVGLGVWCAAVVGSVDNLLRPRMVGRDTEMPDLLILLGTLGGLVLFGATGVIVGPIVAALFVTVWEIYGVAFRDYLPSSTPVDAALQATGPGDPPRDPEEQEAVPRVEMGERAGGSRKVGEGREDGEG